MNKKLFYPILLAISLDLVKGIFLFFLVYHKFMFLSTGLFSLVTLERGVLSDLWSKYFY